jgi:ribonuclease VapC
VIAVDTSALMAMVLDEPDADACSAVVATRRPRIMSAVTLAEALIVSGRRGVAPRMTQVLDVVAPEIVPADAVTARRAADAYAHWGKGVHRARLNLVDCFSYDAAQSSGCALLYVGEDFAQTDVVSALPADRL